MIGRALLVACIAAIGNALFVFGQKKATTGANPFIFLFSSLTLCAFLLLVVGLFFPAENFKTYWSANWKAIAITAGGLFLTYLGFYLLYSRFGASYYIIYAVLSIVTTAIIVGVVIFRETFNVYYTLSILTAVITIVLFFIGQQTGKK